MDHFSFTNGEAACEGVALTKIANEVGTPAYVYSAATLKRHCTNLVSAFSGYPTLACYAVKANSNINILKQIFAQGLGADIVSVGEMKRALLAGCDPKKIVFSGVGKRLEELEAAIEADILSINVESEFELEQLAGLTEKLGRDARISLRLNINVDAKTNPKIATGMYTTKFGIAEQDLDAMIAIVKNNSRLKLIGLACHIGSQMTDLEPLKIASEKMAELAKSLLKQGFPLEILDVGGGLGIRYGKEEPPSLEAYAEALHARVKDTGLQLVIEPGRVLVGNTGVIVSRVIGVKKTPQKNFVVVDAGMNDLMRPAIYDSFHEILPVKEAQAQSSDKINADIVGPICETGDILGRDRDIAKLESGDLVFVRACGAYSAVMASNYNSRQRSPEVLVDGDYYRVIKPRQILEDLWQDEIINNK